MTILLPTRRGNHSLKVVGGLVSLLLGALMMFLGAASFVRAEIAEHTEVPGHHSAVSREAFDEFRANVYRRLDRIEALLEKRHDHSDRPLGR